MLSMMWRKIRSAQVSRRPSGTIWQGSSVACSANRHTGNEVASRIASLWRLQNYGRTQMGIGSRGEKIMWRVVGSVFVAITMVACAGRAPQPVAVVQAQDKHMDCPAISIEIQANNDKVQQLASDKGLKVAQNVTAGVAGLFIPVLWFGMDWQGTEDKEITALQTRQQYLATMAEQRRCGASEQASVRSGGRI